MKSYAAILALAVTAWVAAPAVVQAQEARQDFTLVNKTGYDIKAVFVSANRADDWEEDVLGDDILEDGTQVNIHFKAKTKTCRWDLKVVYEVDDTNAVWKNIDLCKVGTISIFYNKKNDTTRAEFE